VFAAAASAVSTMAKQICGTGINKHSSAQP
jgi:hypothetical protein